LHGEPKISQKPKSGQPVSGQDLKMKNKCYTISYDNQFNCVVQIQHISNEWPIQAHKHASPRGDCFLLQMYDKSGLRVFHSNLQEINLFY
jgi:hypothetical protein